MTKDTNKLQPGETDVNFVSDARLISVLGEQLIGSEKVGLLELVKNAYDAGASTCVVTLEGVPNLEPTSRTKEQYAELPGPIIEIFDDGSGMTEDAIVGGWLRPATSRRAAIKEQLRAGRKAALERGSLNEYDALVEQLRAAHGGRLPLGEKGIGRLATHRLGRFLWLRTKTVNDSLEWELKIDWSLFESPDGQPVDLHKVPLKLRHQALTTTYGDDGHGTVICCYGGREGYEWTRNQIIDVGRAVNALRSPTKGPKGFEPLFTTPHIDSKDLATPLDRIQAPFGLVAVVDERGCAEIEFRYEPPATLPNAPPARTFSESLDLRKAMAKEWSKAEAGKKVDAAKAGSEKASKDDRLPVCGPFILDVRAYLRFTDWLGPDFDEVTEYLNQFGGIAIYRDGLATLPAQQSARADWLGLALAQIKKAANLSYYQLAGEVELVQERTLDLRDRSSREGLIETRAYRDLALLTRSAIQRLQLHVQGIRDEWSKKPERRRDPKTLRAHTNHMIELGRAIVDAYDFKKDPFDVVDKLGGKKAQTNLSAALESFGDLQEQLKLQEEEREGLIEAAGFGLAVNVAVHEISKLAGAIVSDAKRLRTKVEKNSEAAGIAEDLRSRADALLGETKRLAPLRLLRGETARKFTMRSAIEAARNAFVHTLQEVGIILHVNREDFSIRTKFGQIAQVFANLIDNSIYWIGPRGGAIQIAVSTQERTVLVSDNGPGISKHIEPHLFEPFYSEKVPASGLGLYISRHYLGQSKATIRIAKASERSTLTGAQFLLDFSKTPEE